MPAIPDGEYIEHLGEYHASSAPRQARRVTRISTRYQLAELAEGLRMRSDWHEPDEQGVTVRVHGTSFDTAGFWGHDRSGRLVTYGENQQELWVELRQDDRPVAEVCLATLLAWAAGGGHG